LWGGEEGVAKTGISAPPLRLPRRKAVIFKRKSPIETKIRLMPPHKETKKKASGVFCCGCLSSQARQRRNAN